MNKELLDVKRLKMSFPRLSISVLGAATIYTVIEANDSYLQYRWEIAYLPMQVRVRRR